MKIFPSSSIKKLDAYTIEHEPIASIDLMERAATALTKAIMNRWSRETPGHRICRTGNNGETPSPWLVCYPKKDIKQRYISLTRKVNSPPDCQTNKELVEMARK